MKEKTLYIDSNIFLYAKIMDKKYGPACAKILRKIHERKIKATISTLIILEVANTLRKIGLKNKVYDEIRAILSLPLTIQPLTLPIIHETLKIYKENKISPYDCAHAATMKNLKIKHIISADTDFDKIKWIKRIDPLQTT